MKKRPLAKTPDLRYPTYSECRRDRPGWLRRLTIGAAVVGAATWIGCDDIRSLFGKDDGCDVPLPGTMPELITPGVGADDDDSAAPLDDEAIAPVTGEPATPAVEDEPTPADEEARPPTRTRGRMATPHKAKGS